MEAAAADVADAVEGVDVVPDAGDEAVDGRSDGLDTLAANGEFFKNDAADLGAVAGEVEEAVEGVVLAGERVLALEDVSEVEDVAGVEEEAVFVPLATDAKEEFFKKEAADLGGVVVDADDVEGVTVTAGVEGVSEEGADLFWNTLGGLGGGLAVVVDGDVGVIPTAGDEESPF